MEAGAIGPNSFRPVKFNAPSRSKRSLVGVGGLEVRERQCLALTSVRYLMIAHLQNPKHNKINTPSKCRDSNVFKQTEKDAVGVLNSKTP